MGLLLGIRAFDLPVAPSEFFIVPGLLFHFNLLFVSLPLGCSLTYRIPPVSCSLPTWWALPLGERVGVVLKLSK